MAFETMAQDFGNRYERASHSSRFLLVLLWFLLPLAFLFVSMISDGARPYASFWISSFSAREEDWTLQDLGLQKHASRIDIIRRYTRRRILNVRDGDLYQRILPDDPNHGDVCITVFPVRFRISKFP
ncbi:hypothetical protein ARMGADRAFT_1084172 [Armillaria gallica]|nr:hypothetical protein ARMGADRAFT_1084172 [Armillaria gallica]